MADIIWTAYLRGRLWLARLTNWFFLAAKYAVLALIALYVLGSMLAAVLDGLGYPQLAQPIAELIIAVNTFFRGLLA